MMSLTLHSNKSIGILGKMNPKRPSLRHMLIKLYKESELLKVARTVTEPTCQREGGGEEGEGEEA